MSDRGWGNVTEPMAEQIEHLLAERDCYKAALEEVDDLDSTYGEATAAGEIARKALGRPPWPEDEALEGPADA